MYNLKKVFSYFGFGESHATRSESVLLTSVVYHGGSRRNPNKRDYYFSSNRRTAACYAEGIWGRSGLGLERRRLKLENPLIVDAGGGYWSMILFEGKHVSTNQLADIARERGHDSVVIRNVVEGAESDQTRSTTYIILARRPETSPLPAQPCTPCQQP